jgi:hypothetical protein
MKKIENICQIVVQNNRYFQAKKGNITWSSPVPKGLPVSRMGPKLSFEQNTHILV